MQTQGKDGSHHCHHAEHLKDSHPPMPCHGAHLAEVHLAERHEKHAEHKHGEERGEDRLGFGGESVKGGDEGKNEIDPYARADRHGKGPVLYEVNDVHG